MKIKSKPIPELKLELYVILYKKKECKKVRKWLNKELEIDFEILEDDYGCLHKDLSRSLTVLCVQEEEDVETVRMRYLKQLFHFCWWAKTITDSQESCTDIFSTLFEWYSDVMAKPETKK